MIESVLSCHFQSPFLLLGRLSFVPSVTTMFQAILVVQSPSICCVLYPPSLSLIFLVIPLSFLLPVLFRLSCFSLVFMILWLHLIWGEGSGGVVQHRDALGGFSLWKQSNLNADGNIFWGFNSTMCSIPNMASSFFLFTQVLFVCWYWCIWLMLRIWINQERKQFL